VKKIRNRAIALAAARDVDCRLRWRCRSQARAAAMPVFDTTNYAQNLLQAARALEQINNQISSLQNEAAMLRNMGKQPRADRLPAARAGHGARCSASTADGAGEGIDFQDRPARRALPGLFPGSRSAPSSSSSSRA
jgi:hypothetical protein